MIAPRPHTVSIVGGASAAAPALIAMFAWMSWNSYRIVIAETYVSSSNRALSVEQFVARTIETIDLSLQAIVDEIETGRVRTPAHMPSLLAERRRRSAQITGLVIIGADGRNPRRHRRVFRRRRPFQPPLLPSQAIATASRSRWAIPSASAATARRSS
jgi:hypothetical protein